MHRQRFSAVAIDMVYQKGSLFKQSPWPAVQDADITGDLMGVNIHANRRSPSAHRSCTRDNMAFHLGDADNWRRVDKPRENRRCFGRIRQDVSGD